MRQSLEAPGVYSIFDTEKNTVRVPVTGNRDLGGGVGKGRQVRIVGLSGGQSGGWPLTVSVRSSKRIFSADFAGPYPSDYLQVEPVSNLPVEPGLRLFALSIEQEPPAGETYVLEAHSDPEKFHRPAGFTDAKPLPIEILSMNPPGGNLPIFAGGDRNATRDAMIAECRRQGVVILEQIAYVLATVEHETGNAFKPVREGQFGHHPPEQSEGFRRRHLRYEQDGVGKSSFVYFGRGYVQLTHNSNYTKFGNSVVLDLASDPDLALRPNVALYTLVRGMREGTFTGLSLSSRIDPKGRLAMHQQFKRARAIINGDGGINGEKIAKIADRWLNYLRPPPPPPVRPATNSHNRHGHAPARPSR